MAAARRARKARLYAETGEPSPGLNSSVRRWLDEGLRVVEHQPPAAFDGIRGAYQKIIKTLLESGLTPREAHRKSLSALTQLMFGHDLTEELSRLAPGLINVSGFRTTLSQGFAKNIGENFVNLLVYAFSILLEHQDEVLVDKGLPPMLKSALTLQRNVQLASGEKKVNIVLEGDMAIFSRSDPSNAIVLSAKTRLKEVFHIGTMWKLFFDMIGDSHCLGKWDLVAAPTANRAKLSYVFATADMVNAAGNRSQGPDVERDEPRNLIAMDASFFDYVFVSKTGISHVSNTLKLSGIREALFHELGCLIDMTEQKFGITLGSERALSNTAETAETAI